MQSSKFSRSKWDVWASIFWFIAFLTIPLAIYVIAKLGFVQVPSFSGSYSTRLEFNPGILVYSLAIVASAFFAAAFFGLINDIYKRTFSSTESADNHSSDDSWSAQTLGVKVKAINDGSPLESKIKVGWRLVEVNDEAIHRSAEVSSQLVAGQNNLKFIGSDSKPIYVSLKLTTPPKLGLILE